MKTQLNRWFVRDPGSWQEFILAAMPWLMTFLIPGLISGLSLEARVSTSAGLVILGLMFLTLAALGVIGLLVRVPRWSLPYAGVPLVLLAFLLLATFDVIEIFFGGMTAAWWLRLLGFLSVYLVLLHLLLYLAYAVAKRVDWLAPVLALHRQDWSLLSFAMYGGALTFVMGMYEDLQGAGWYLVATAMLLILGAWVFLRSAHPSRRVIPLLAGITLAMAAGLLANLQLLPWESPAVFSLGGLAITRVMVSVLLTWGVCVVMILSPAALIPVFTRERASREASPTQA